MSSSTESECSIAGETGRKEDCMSVKLITPDNTVKMTVRDNGTALEKNKMIKRECGQQKDPELAVGK